MTPGPLYRLTNQGSERWKDGLVSWEVDPRPKGCEPGRYSITFTSLSLHGELKNWLFRKEESGRSREHERKDRAWNQDPEEGTPWELAGVTPGLEVSSSLRSTACPTWLPHNAESIVGRDIIPSRPTPHTKHSAHDKYSWVKITEWVSWSMVTMIKRNKKNSPISSKTVNTSSLVLRTKWINDHVSGISQTESYLNLAMTPFHRWENRDSEELPNWSRVIQKAWFNPRVLFNRPELGCFSPCPLHLPGKHSTIFQGRSLSSGYSAWCCGHISALHRHLQSWTGPNQPSVPMLSSLQAEGMEGTSRLLFYSQSKKRKHQVTFRYMFIPKGSGTVSPVPVSASIYQS